MADIRYTVTIDTATGVAGIQKLEGEFDKLAGTTKKTTEHAGFLDSSFVKLAATLAATFGIVSIGQKAWSSFTGLMKDSVTAAKEQENADMALKSSLAITGREVSLNAGHFQQYAAQIQKTTVFADEQVESAQALLLQLTHLNRDGIDQATRGSIGLASALGIDLQSASMMVAKAMEGNYAALSRYGIKVDENLSATEKQAALLRQLEMMYKRATDATETFAGSQAQLKNTFGELKESIGEVFTKSESVRTAIRMLKDAMEDLNDGIKGHKKNFLDMTGQFTTAIPIIGEVSRALGWGALAYKKMDEAVKDLWKSQTKVVDQWISMDEWLTTLAADALHIDRNFKNIKYAFAPAFTTQLGETPMLVGRVRNAYKWLTEELGETTSKGREMGMVLTQAPEKIGQQVTWLIDKTAILRERFLYVFNQIAESASNLFGSLAALSSANKDRQIDDLDKYYEAQKKLVIDSLMTEQQKADALKVLDEKQEIARKAIARSAAKDEKSYNIFQAIINTAVAITKALSSAVPPWNFILAAMSAAAGAIQIATIKAQPIPLAQGGIFTQPTHIMAEAGAEAVIPLDRIQDVARRMGGGGRVTHLHQHIYFGGQKIKEQILEIVERASGEGTLKIRAKAIT